MKATDLKYYVGIISIMVIDSLHVLFFDNDKKYDVYLFYNHERYFTNILYDISNLFSFTIVLYFLQGFNRRIFQPLFYLSFFSWGFYFLFYNQIGSLLLIPIYLFLILYFKWKNK